MRGFRGSLCVVRGAFRHLRARQPGRHGSFCRGSLPIEAGPLADWPIGLRIDRHSGLLRRPGLRPFEGERSGSCGCSGPLDLSPYDKSRQENVDGEQPPDEEARGERPWAASRSDGRTSRADLGTAPFGLVKDTQLNAPSGSPQAGERMRGIVALLDFQQSVTQSYSR